MECLFRPDRFFMPYIFCYFLIWRYTYLVMANGIFRTMEFIFLPDTEKKTTFYYNFLLLMIRKIIFFSFMKIFFSFIISLILFPGTGNISGTIIIFYLLNTLVEIILCMIQLILEIILDSRWALCIIAGYYIASIVAADILYFYNIKNSAFFFFVNWGMKSRLDVLETPYLIFFILLLLFGCILTVIGQAVAEKKEIL